ncbi:phage head spike fiber domain-containing protein [Halomonas getboli]|uniref:phage head spike fiber domain-containing protein n=1 Tax=Halomonas getboli TaxID=2935862 RepID=UPI001FFFE1F9|nr:hypothetical protein [Halomonas getboli]MCK2185690.1 hypothetical protein [Halomonas getboli]
MAENDEIQFHELPNMLGDELADDDQILVHDSSDTVSSLYGGEKRMSVAEYRASQILAPIAAAVQAANEQTTRLNRSFSVRPYNGESLRADFEAQAYGLGDTTGISRAVGEGEMFTVQRATPKHVFQPVAGGAIQLVEVPPDTLAHEWDPVTGEYLGVLIEESRTNLEPDSSDFTAWTSTNGYLTDTGATALGGLSVYRASHDGNGSSVTARTPLRYSQPRETAIAVSGFVKNEAATQIKLHLGDNGISGYARVVIDTATGAVILDEHSNWAGAGSVGAKYVGDGWYRIWVVSTVPAAGSATQEIMVIGDGDLLFTGIQKEEGTFPTSYIPTAGSAVTRAADDVSHSAGEEYAPTGSTWVVELDDAKGESPFIISTDNEEFSPLYISSGGNFAVDLRGVGHIILSTSISRLGKRKVAVSLGVNEVLIAADGASESIASGLSLEYPANDMLLGSRANGTRHMNGHIKRFEYIPESRTAAQLEEMTA